MSNPARNPMLDQLPELKDHYMSRTVAPGGTLFLEGEVPKVLYQVKRGLAKMVHNSATGREMIAELVFPGQFIDPLGSLDGKPYALSAHATNLNELEVLAVPREFALRHPVLLTACHRQCMELLRESRERLASIALERVEQRAAQALTMLAEHLGAQDFQMCLTRKEFADLIGATQETGVRVLSALRRQGAIHEDCGRLTLTHRLRELCPVA